MSEQSTPETDAACGYALNSNEGRSEGSYLQIDRSGPFVHVEVARKLERERDDARAEWGKASMDAAQLLSEKTKVIAERDEAREQAQRLRVQLNHYTQANEMAEQAFRERDEAHKIAKQAIADLAWFNETNAQRLGFELEQLKEDEK